MRISERERLAIIHTIRDGHEFGFGNLISHLQTAWAKTLMNEYGFSERVARMASGGDGYPFAMQTDLVANGKYDEPARHG